MIKPSLTKLFENEENSIDIDIKEEKVVDINE